MNLYTIVTNDQYEFPIKCDLLVREAAEFLNISKNAVRQRTLRQAQKSKYKIIITGKTKFDSHEYNKKYSMTHDRTEYFRQYHKTRYNKQQKKE